MSICGGSFFASSVYVSSSGFAFVPSRTTNLPSAVRVKVTPPYGIGPACPPMTMLSATHVPTTDGASFLAASFGAGAATVRARPTRTEAYTRVLQRHALR
jgi:hypothetical protein